MSKTITFLIGNGLGKSLDPDYFSLKQGMEKGWELTKSTKIKSLIINFLGKNKPRTEKDLKKIQDCFLTLQSIENQIKGLPKSLVKDLEINIKQNKQKYYTYLFNTASHFYNYSLDNTDKKEMDKFRIFINKFCGYIKDRKINGNTVHVATLNYDGLLYKAFINNQIFGIEGDKAYNTCYLVDGFWVNTDGFKKEHLQRYPGRNFGWYLHLHGSPLFYSKGHIINKKGTSGTAFEQVTDDKLIRNHLILCHPSQKYELIQHSELLREYLEHFKIALSHTDSLIVFGYGGDDTHINDIIKQHLKKDGLIWVIERSESSLESRSQFWKNRLCTKGTKLKLIQKKSILDFNFDCATHKATAS